MVLNIFFWRIYIKQELILPAKNVENCMVVTEKCSALTFAFQFLNMQVIVLLGISVIPKGFLSLLSLLLFFMNVNSITHYTDTWFIHTQMEFCSPETKVCLCHLKLCTLVPKWHIRTEIPRNSPVLACYISPE